MFAKNHDEIDCVYFCSNFIYKFDNFLAFFVEECLCLPKIMM